MVPGAFSTATPCFAASPERYQAKPSAVTPDKTIAPSWADVKAGRDPVLDWVLAQPAPS